MRVFIYFLLGGFLLTAPPVALAQTGPDTLRTKEQLPTGLPGADRPTDGTWTQPAPARQPAPRTPAPVPQVVRPSQLNKLYTGGNVGLNLFGPFFFVDVSPILGYKLTEWFSFGPGVVYQYTRQHNIGYSNFGVKGFARVQIIPILFLHAEHEVLRVPVWRRDPNGQLAIDSRVSLQTSLVGAGYRQRISERAAMDTMVLLNVSGDRTLSPYSNPVLRAGFYYEF